MKIYTKTGDKGETGLFGGGRVPKDSLRIEAYGSVDELNSVIGIIRSLHPHRTIDGILHRIQNDLFVLGADLATPSGVGVRVPRIKAGLIRTLEKNVDALEQFLPQLKRFILPGGTEAASFLHLARTVSRRSERSVVRLSREETVGPWVLMYLNRLSDLLFVLARYANHVDKCAEVAWDERNRRRRTSLST